ncbi:uncharacterized protein LOC126676663 [Mercurialis annua]|uniref:uncharacterized protein LOC126676663 n=1 Tax=Mercurialis annua TaxID=3986 RepID=UPI00215FBF07|nr:uncharacterized protein LOC126676663 [Mercurialis annua]
MYVTRPLSLYRNHPSAISEDPPEGPYSGCLVITDEEAAEQDAYCFGACKKRRIKRLPFPQDKILNVVHFSDYEETLAKKVWFLPVLDQPLSSNTYYVIKAKGRFKGQAIKCSRDMDMSLCCFKKVIKDKKPKPLDPTNIYQKFKIHSHHSNTFFAKSLAPYGHPPKLLREKGWRIRSSKSRPYKFQLSDALGLDATLRTQFPSLNFTTSTKISSSIIVGTWYCPFVFIREESRIRQQMKKSMLYKMTLEQHWEEIYSWENVNNETNISLIINANVQRVDYSVFGMEAKKDDKISYGGFIWYKGIIGNRNNNRGRGFSVGLSFVIVEKMKWVLEGGGWVDGEKNVGIERNVEIRSENRWRRFKCYVLVESFVWRRLDGSLVLKCNFRHTDKIKCKCE